MLLDTAAVLPVDFGFFLSEDYVLAGEAVANGVEAATIFAFLGAGAGWACARGGVVGGASVGSGFIKVSLNKVVVKAKCPLEAQRAFLRRLESLSRFHF
jgi:hypothetical protein